MTYQILINPEGIASSALAIHSKQIRSDGINTAKKIALYIYNGMGSNSGNHNGGNHNGGDHHHSNLKKLLEWFEGTWFQTWILARNPKNGGKEGTGSGSDPKNGGRRGTGSGSSPKNGGKEGTGLAQIQRMVVRKVLVRAAIQRMVVRKVLVRRTIQRMVVRKVLVQAASRYLLPINLMNYQL